MPLKHRFLLTGVLLLLAALLAVWFTPFAVSHGVRWWVWWRARQEGLIVNIDKIDAPFLPHSHQRREVRAFLRTAHRLHVRAVSLWSWQTAGPAQWHALKSYRTSFRPHHHR